MIKSLKFILLITMLSVLSGCATTGGNNWKLGEVAPEFRSYEKTDLDPLKAKKIPKSSLNYRKYDDFFNRAHRLIITVDFTLNLIQEIDKKRKSGESPAEEIRAALTVYNMLPKLQAESEELSRQGKDLIASAKDDFSGRMALRLPAVTQSLADTVTALKETAGKFIQIANRLTTLASASGEVPDKTAKKEEHPAESHTGKQAAETSQKEKTAARSRSVKGPEGKEEAERSKEDKTTSPENTETAAKTETDARAKPEAKTETDAKTKPEAKTETDAKTKSEATTETDTKTKPEATTETDTKTKPEATTETDAKTKPEAKSESDAKTESTTTAVIREDPDIEANLPMEDRGNGSISYGTKLLWQKCSHGQDENACSGNPEPQTWHKAVLYCESLSLLGGKWRLPTIKELRVLLDNDKEKGPRIRMQEAFSSTRQDVYWTSSPYQNDIIAIWVVDFSTGMVFAYGSEYPGYTRCVSDLQSRTTAPKTKETSPTTGHENP